MGQPAWVNKLVIGRIVCVAGCFLIAALLALVLMIPVYPYGSENNRESDCRMKLKQIALALLNYHDRYGSFPPAYIPDGEGRPMHSWRVLLLPYLERFHEYKAYRFNEPWDSPHNRIIIRSVAFDGTYRCASAVFQNPRNSYSQETNYMMIVGAGTISPGAHPGRLEQIRDDPSTTLIVAEVYDTGVVWAEPVDLDVEEMSFRINDSSSNAIRSRHRGGANAVFCDGQVCFLREELDPTVLKAMTTVRGNEVVRIRAVSTIRGDELVEIRPLD